MLNAALVMSPRRLFRDRADAGRALAERLRAYRASPIVLALPRGGVPVAYEVARELDAPLDVCVVRKIGAPGQPELGIGAVAEDGAVYVDRAAARYEGVSEERLAALVAEKRAEVEDRAERFRHGAAPLDVRGRTVLVVDDGVATGGTARAALQTLRARGAGWIVLAVPVGSTESLEALASVADEIVCLHAEEPFFAVGLWYEDFSTTTDEDVIVLLEQARADRQARDRQPARSGQVQLAIDRDVRVPIGGQWLAGRLTIPASPRGLVVFAHGSGSNRESPRNQHVARELRGAGLATLLIDLFTDAEAAAGQLTADIRLQAARLVAATEWARGRAATKGLPVGYFGASTGAAAALVAAAERPDLVHAIVCRGGRPDLAEASLPDVHAPTLLMVGGADPEVLRLNRESLALLGGDKDLEIIAGASHLFEEPGALDRVARSAVAWYGRHLAQSPLHAIA